MKQFGSYTVKRVLPSAGGPVSVFQAVNTEGLAVLLRVLTSEVDPNSDEYLRFQTEFETLRALFHPHILPVLDLGEVDGKPFYAAPADSFHTLADHRREGRVEFEWFDAVAIGIQLADALAHMHQARILHRDLKLSGVIYDIESRQAMISEFALVRNFELPSLTLQGVKMGALPRVMPETTRGEALTERSDVYQLANLLYELLAKEPGVGFDFSYRPLSGRGVEAPEAFDRVLETALQEETEKRYPDALAFQEALRSLVPSEAD